MDCQEILAQLIRYPSITPHDAGCQDFMLELLEQAGFHCQRLNAPPVSNFYAQLGSEGPLFIFAGHTDVVPPGDLNQWHSNPFQLHSQDGKLYGRGVADMKGSLACMLTAVLRFATKYPQFSGRLGLLITSGEEGDDYQLGTPFVMQHLQAQGLIPDYCIVGEPSSTAQIGDMIKIGRRGSLSGFVTLQGKQGHVAYPHLADNPIHRIAPAIAELTQHQWDNGNAHFPPTTFQITHFQAGGNANNVIPGQLSFHFNFRYSTEQTATQLKNRVEACFARHQLTPEIRWQQSGEPFLTAKGNLLEHCIEVIQQHTGQQPELSTSGGTSDGRFIAPYGVEVIELGLVNTTIHQVNEAIHIDELEQLSELYYALCVKMLSSKN